MKRYYVLIILLLGAILVSCNMPRKTSPPSDQQLMETAARQTVVSQLATGAVLTQTAISGQPTQEMTATLEPTQTLTFTNSPVPIIPNTPIPCNWVGFISDVTIPDNAQVVAGSTFTKIWRLQNIGSCTWTSGYRLAYSHGDRMSAPDNIAVTSGTVPYGAMVDVAVDLVAPSAPGTYQGYFKLRSPENYLFGIGGSANEAFWVKVIVVAQATDTPTPTTTFTPTLTFTPTATNTTGPPNFVLSYENVHDCGGAPYATTRVDNIGGAAFESVQITIEDLTAATTLYGPATNDNPYLAGSGDCPPQSDALAPGGTAYIAASISGYTSGNTARETLVMCTQNGLAGDCVTRTVDFVLP